MASLSSDTIAQSLRSLRNPYDLLLEVESPSLLDLGAGDLSFIDELVTPYLPRLKAQGKPLTVHGLDRLSPGSALGGPLHADPGRLKRLQQSDHLRFQFWGDVDMLASAQPQGLLPRYTIVTCHAPATPTFALEPTRVSETVIDQYLRQTKGEFRIVREGNEEALEVLHRGRALLFPPWKFDIRGPLALLDVMSRRGQLCVCSAVDADVFWEILSQLVADPRMRPKDVIFTPVRLAEVFGPVYEKLVALPVGGSVNVAEVAELRSDLPRVLGGPGTGARTYRFRYVEVRRGAIFEGLPASQTARLFKDMKEEAPPWLLVLVPEEA